jgi:crotonobetainyl-CoA:carnitine CoA-transferase CaiB-like acyl-CoA transferase
MASDNIFTGLKVVDLASFIAGPSAAVILSDFFMFARSPYNLCR